MIFLYSLELHYEYEKPMSRPHQKKTDLTIFPPHIHSGQSNLILIMLSYLAAFENTLSQNNCIFPLSTRTTQIFLRFFQKPSNFFAHFYSLYYRGQKSPPLSLRTLKTEYPHHQLHKTDLAATQGASALALWPFGISFDT